MEAIGTSSSIIRVDWRRGMDRICRRHIAMLRTQMISHKPLRTNTTPSLRMRLSGITRSHRFCLHIARVAIQKLSEKSTKNCTQTEQARIKELYRDKNHSLYRTTSSATVWYSQEQMNTEAETKQGQANKIA